MVPGRYVVDAVLLGGLSPTELSRKHRISRSRVYQLLALFRKGGYEALELKSRRPKSCSHQVTADVEEAILELRRDLTRHGHDAGPHTISHHLASRFDDVPSTSTIWRVLHRNGLVHKGQVVRLFVADLEVRVVRDDGLLIRDLILDPSRKYQGLEQAHTVHDVVRHVSNMS